jgi:hypothetical protein
MKVKNLLCFRSGLKATDSAVSETAILAAVDACSYVRYRTRLFGELRFVWIIGWSEGV